MWAETLERHDLVALTAGAPDPLPGAVPEAARVAWSAAGRPLIVRRGSREGGLPLGLALPPAMGKARIAVRVPVASLCPRRPPGPGEIAEVGPPGWGETLEAAAGLAHRYGVRVTPFGGLLWQCLTGLAYLHPGSDLDLLWRCPARMPPGLPGAISDLAAGAPMRLDGEIVVAGWGVQWCELAQAGPEDAVLCRGGAGIEMRPARCFAGVRAA